MKLLTSKNNPLSLKIHISAILNKIQLEIQEPNNDDPSFPVKGLSPVLQLDNGMYLFSPNAACSYLMEMGGLARPDGDSHIDEWLEWEVTQLQPLLFLFLQDHYKNQKPCPSLVSAIKTCLSHLQSSVKGQKYLVGNKLSAADIAVWATLFPVVTDVKLSKELLPPDVIEWYTTLAAENEAFKKSADKLCPIRGADSCKQAISAMVIHCQPSTTQRTEPEGKGKSRTDSGSYPLSPVRSLSESSSSKEPPVLKDEIDAAQNAWIYGKSQAPALRQRKHPILPKQGEKNILVTSALPYVNNVPHLGNIIGCVLSADVFSRFCRQRGDNVLYICGTDEYGTATETKALEEGLSPRAICDKYHAIHVDIYKWFNIDFDCFGRTTTEQQTRICQDIFWKLHKNGYMTEDSVDQLLCEKCNRFLADRFVEGTCPLCAYEDARGDQCDGCGKLINATELRNPRCKVCGASPVIRTSRHIFIDLPKIEPICRDWLDKASLGWSSNARVIARSWIKDGLKPRCITRDLKWGTPVPLEGFTDKVFYVWFDAPIGYLSITNNYVKEWEKWWKNPQNVTHYEFMAKDNVPFHGVVFPCSQLGANDNYTIVNHLMATEYLNYEDGKFSKSRGVGVFGNDAKDTGIPADVWRFYLLFVRPENQDSTFSWVDLATKNNSELLNNLGNFINRALMFVERYFEGCIPDMSLQEDDLILLANINREIKSYIECLSHARLRDGLKHILAISRHGNQHMQAQEPWVMVKGNDQEKLRAGTVVGVCANIACTLSVLMHPYMPSVSLTIQTQLNVPENVNVMLDKMVCHLPSGHKIGKPSPLFQKIEMSKVEELKKRFSGRQSKSPSPAPALKTQVVVNNSVIPTTPPKADPVEAQKLLVEVTAQGEIVRQLKTNKAPKTDIDKEVAKLLELKCRLAVAEGKDPAAAAPAKSGKKKGKK